MIDLQKNAQSYAQITLNWHTVEKIKLHLNAAKTLVYMSTLYIEDKIFKAEDVAAAPLQTGEYDNCTFSGCNLSGANLSGAQFLECTFNNCDISMATLTQTVLRDVVFNDCKLLGLHFDDCDAFLLSVECRRCILDFSSFLKLRLKKTKFIDCGLKQTDFSEADLTEAVFRNCNMEGTIFDNTILEKADLSTSFHYNIDPERNRIKKAKFSLDGLPGLLNKYGIEIA